MSTTDLICAARDLCQAVEDYLRDPTEGRREKMRSARQAYVDSVYEEGGPDLARGLLAAVTARARPVSSEDADAAIAGDAWGKLDEPQKPEPGDRRSRDWPAPDRDRPEPQGRSVAPGGRPLTDAERAFANAARLEIGFDDDREELHQYVHVCWPYATNLGTLCHSPRLWFHGGAFVGRRANGREDEVDCAACLGALAVLMRGRAPATSEALKPLLQQYAVQAFARDQAFTHGLGLPKGVLDLVHRMADETATREITEDARVRAADDAIRLDQEEEKRALRAAEDAVSRDEQRPWGWGEEELLRALREANSAQCDPEGELLRYDDWGTLREPVVRFGLPCAVLYKRGEPERLLFIPPNLRGKDES